MLAPSTTTVRPEGMDVIVILVFTTAAVKFAVTDEGNNIVRDCGFIDPRRLPVKFTKVKFEAALAVRRSWVPSV